MDKGTLRFPVLGEEIACIRSDEMGKEGIFIPMKPVVERLRLTWASQLRLLKRDPILGKCLTYMETTSEGSDGKTYPVEMVCLPLPLFFGWLFKASAALPIGDPLVEVFLRYQEECFALLFIHFYGEQPLHLGEARAAVRPFFGPPVAWQRRRQ